MPSRQAGPASASSGRWLALPRAAGFGCVVGVVLGGVAGTSYWPVVGTFFGAIAGTAAGAVIGLIDGLVLVALAESTRSAWLARCVSAAVAAACAAAAWPLSGGFELVPSAGGQVALAAVCVLAAGWLGPFIAHGAEPISLGRRAAPLPMSGIAAMFLLRGGVAGAVPGGIVGLIIGIRGNLPTAPAAVVEGAVLGAVSGVVMAFALSAALVGPRLRVRH